MKYVNALRRIARLNDAISNAPTTEKYDDIVNKLFDKRDILKAQLRAYTHCPDRTNQYLRRLAFQRRKQVKLACRILRINYYTLYAE